MTITDCDAACVGVLWYCVRGSSDFLPCEELALYQRSVDAYSTSPRSGPQDSDIPARATKPSVTVWGVVWLRLPHSRLSTPYYSSHPSRLRPVALPLANANTLVTCNLHDCSRKAGTTICSHYKECRISHPTQHQVVCMSANHRVSKFPPEFATDSSQSEDPTTYQTLG